MSGEGLEPSWPKPPHFECGASTNSATRPMDQINADAQNIHRILLLCKKRIRYFLTIHLTVYPHEKNQLLIIKDNILNNIFILINNSIL